MSIWTEQEQKKFEEITAQLNRWTDSPCQSCDSILTSEDILYSNALGFKNFPKCLSCLSNGLERNKNELKTELLKHIQRRPCLKKAYEISFGKNPDEFDSTLDFIEAPSVSSGTPALAANLVWNAGDLGCGDLVLLLRGKLKAMPPGEIIQVTALDPGAPEDIPAWCNMTGNKLVFQQHPNYFIKNKE
jgi:tRNA 2-thiouridine synthesizing protein A